MIHTLPTLRRFAVGATLLLCASAQAAPPVIEGKDGWLFAGWESGDKVDEATLAANTRLLQEAQTALAARGVALLVLVVPAKAPFYPDRLPAGAISPPVAARYASVLAQLGKAGLATLDDRAVLQAVEGAPVEGQGAEKQTAFYRADYHWTAWSAEASAAAVAGVINTRWPLPASTSPGTALGAWTRDRHYGDLADNFLSPADRKRIGRDSYTVRAASTNDAALLDSAPPQVTVVGNSFVQPYLGFPQKLSNALGQPVGLTWNPGNISPWKTLLDAVASPGFAAHKPKVLVWQLNEARMDTSPDSTAAWDAGSAMPASAWRSKLQAALAK
jgi:alginate O-acetyltransferase complex protein AlgJ